MVSKFWDIQKASLICMLVQLMDFVSVCYRYIFQNFRFSQLWMKFKQDYLWKDIVAINLVFLFIKTFRNFIYDTKNHQGRKVVLIFCSE